MYTHTHTHTQILFLTSSIMFHHKWLDIFPCAIQQISLLIHSKCNSLHLLTPNSQSIPLPLPPPWQLQVCSPCPWVCFCSVDKFICARYYVAGVSNNIWYLSFSFWLTSLSLRVSSSINVAANGIFKGWVVFHCMYVPHLLNPFICLWICELLPCLGYCE